MNFKQAYQEMLKGKKIKRPGWGGYWFIEDGKVKIKLKTGEILENNFNEETIPNTVADDWEVVGEKKKWWEPKFDETYWSIKPWSGVVRTCYNDPKADETAKSMGFCFQTAEQAEFMTEKLKVIHELEKFAFENNEKEMDWGDGIQKKFYLFLKACENNTIDILYAVGVRSNPFNVYFTSEEIAKKAIETIGEDRIKKYYFGVEDE